MKTIDKKTKNNISTAIYFETLQNLSSNNHLICEDVDASNGTGTRATDTIKTGTIKTGTRATDIIRTGTRANATN